MAGVQGNPAFPQQNVLTITSWSSSGAVPVPPVPLNTYYLAAWATDGLSLVGVGGWNGTDATAACVSVTAALQWHQQPPYPVALYGSAAAIGSGMVIVVGGADQSLAAHADVNAASLDGTGLVGGWTAQPPLPVAGLYSAAAASGSTIYVIGADDGVGGQTAAVWSAPLTNGSVGAWTALQNYPIPVSMAQAVVINGWLVVIGGSASGVQIAAVYAARINADGSLGGWLPWPSLPAGLQFAQAIVIDNHILVCGGTVAGPAYPSHSQTLSVGRIGGPAAAWSVLPAPLYAEEGNALASFMSQTCYSFTHGNTTSVTTVPVISVPLSASGLTAFHKYHIVFSATGGTLNLTDSQVLIGTGAGGGGGAAQNKVGAGAWTAYGGATLQVPLTIYAGAGGRIVHTLADVTSGVAARYTWLLWDFAGKLIGVGEVTGANTRSFRAIQYDPDGLPTGLV